MRHTTVADVMSTNVISASPQDSFSELAMMLRNAAIRAVPVVDDDGRLQGAFPRPT
jgi:CBS-domain-containing membrane protein